MLPILRILPVGGVILALLLLILALKTPGERPLPPDMITARGPLLDLNEHPEWRQDLMQAALRRADELTRLRDLRDTPAHEELPVEAPLPLAIPQVSEVELAPASFEQTIDNAEPEPALKVAILPTDRVESDPDVDSITGSIEQVSASTIPVEIGAASTFELPIVLPPERPAVIRTPERVKPLHESRSKRVRRVSRAKQQAPKPAAPTNLFELFFSGALFSPDNYPVASSGINNSSPEFY